jgi:hypothetical protein
MRVRDAVRQEIHHEVKRPRHSLNLGVFFSLLFCQVLGFLRNKTKHGQKRRRKNSWPKVAKVCLVGCQFPLWHLKFLYNSNRRGYPLLSLTHLLCVPGGVLSAAEGREPKNYEHTNKLRSLFLPSIGKEDTVVWVVCLHGSMFDFRLSCCIWQTTRVLSFIFCLDIKKENINLRLMAL